MHSYPGAAEGVAGRQPSPSGPYGNEKIESDERLFTNTNKGAPLPSAAEQWKQQAKHAYAAANGDLTDPLLMMANPSAMSAHHRKLSSFSSIGALLGSTIFSAPGGGDGSAENNHPLKGHHRATSSTVSFLQGLDVLEGSDVMFLRNLQSTTANYGGPTVTSAPQQSHQPTGGGMPTIASSESSQGSRGSGTGSATPSGGPNGFSMGVAGDSDGNSASTKLAPGGTSKRVRRKCTVADCPNRVVQGGLCISHGAKRKTCRHPGCNKNVKKAGLCSTHGPARRRCDAEGCSKVAVQGGRCIAHGAKKKMCSVDNCKKQAILSGMCKKHHDKLSGADPNNPPMCVVIGSNSDAENRPKAGHQRGLSIFQDLSADAVQGLLEDDDEPLNFPG